MPNPGDPLSLGKYWCGPTLRVEIHWETTWLASGDRVCVCVCVSVSAFWVLNRGPGEKSIITHVGFDLGQLTIVASLSTQLYTQIRYIQKSILLRSMEANACCAWGKGLFALKLDSKCGNNPNSSSTHPNTSGWVSKLGTFQMAGLFQQL